MDTLDIESFAGIEIPNLDAQVEEALKPRAPLPVGTYLAVITDTNLHYGDQKPGKPGRSVGWFVELSINPKTQQEVEGEDLLWVPTDKLVSHRQYVWLGYIDPASGRVVFLDGMPRGAAQLLQAVKAAGQFKPGDYVGTIVKVAVSHREYVGNDGNDYVGLEARITRHTQNGEVVVLDIPRVQKQDDPDATSPFD